jgi:hypothetical protein
MPYVLPTCEILLPDRNKVMRRKLVNAKLMTGYLMNRSITDLECAQTTIWVLTASFVCCPLFTLVWSITIFNLLKPTYFDIRALGETGNF